ncbi:hypothetical protein DL98DRAFT_267792 [Cadophora sp. DSE1049]|nr:hypothetical protein DL98DRAFT_267792 [Cadophora sp. DSE1049]
MLHPFIPSGPLFLPSYSPIQHCRHRHPRLITADRFIPQSHHRFPPSLPLLSISILFFSPIPCHQRKKTNAQTHQSQSSYLTGNNTYFGQSLTVTPALLELELEVDVDFVSVSVTAYMAALWALQMMIVDSIIPWV